MTNGKWCGMLVIGVDIGGTKCAVSLGRVQGGNAEVLFKATPHPTARYTPTEMLRCLLQDIEACTGLCRQQWQQAPAGIGISCGGPLDSTRGVILSPPNLPGWDEVEISAFFREKAGLPAWLCNDANACALAEWKLGAGQGCSNMVFMTFGTGLGAGLILNGALYPGACEMAGEVGHLRLRQFGPVGYGKMGSFEGFCSGGGIAQLVVPLRAQWLAQGNTTTLPPAATAHDAALAAAQGDGLALELFRQVGELLGEGLALLVDILNPERIIIGSIFARCHAYIWPACNQKLAAEALPQAYAACRVLPSALGDRVGDYAALMVAAY